MNMAESTFAQAARPTTLQASPFAQWTLDRPEADEAYETIRVIDANPSAMALFGARNRTALLQPMAYLFAASPDTAERVLAAYFAGCPEHVEDMTIRRFDGRTRQVLLHVIFPPPAEATETIRMLMTDITGRLRQDAAAATFAHEIRQPLSAIVSNTDAALRWLDRDAPPPEKIPLLLNRIAANARRARDILLRGDQPGDKRERLDLNLVVAEICELARPETEARRIHFELALANEAPRARGDRVQLQQVIFNLLMNAVQAIDPSPAGRRHIRLGVSSDAAWARISVTDSGPGIPPADLDRIFTRAYTTKPDGMGIGLAICRSIVQAHGGEIRASNTPGGGACLEVLLPLQSDG